MRLPDLEKLMGELPWPTTLIDLPTHRLEGRLIEVTPTLLRAHLPGVGLGEQCLIDVDGRAEVVGVHGDQALLAPYYEPVAVKAGMFVRPAGTSPQVGVDNTLLGRVLDALGHPIDNLEQPVYSAHYPLEADPPHPLSRKPVDAILPTGVRAIDAALTIGVGQRVGIFAPAGCGKSVLLSMLCQGCAADVVVVTLIGERGREVREFIDTTLDEASRARSVVVVATSDRPAMERIKAAATATAIAEFFRDQGKRVLLLMDSLTRYARAVREIALAAGEPVLTAGYPPSLYARLPRLLERTGAAKRGSITAFYTILTDEKSDPLADEVRSILDGHIILSRKLADANHFPAIDVLASISRVMMRITTENHIKHAARLRQLLQIWRDIELLIRVGEYHEGHDPDADDAYKRHAMINDFLCQPTDIHHDFQSTLKLLEKTVPC